MTKKLILVLNCGSSSVKFSIIDPIQSIIYLDGMVESVQHITSLMIYDHFMNKKLLNKFNKIDSYKQLIILIFNTLSVKYKNYLNYVIGIGHRVVHGGKHLNKSMIINDYVLSKIKQLSIFAPLHNPFHVIAITVSLQKMLKLKNSNVAVFDTAFHHTIPKESFLYAIPYQFYKNYSIRRYGAHGINHLYVTQQCSLFLNKSIDQINIISCHLGSGSSVTAIVNGKSVDTSMGLTPLEGLMMGTRCGDIDPYIIFYMIQELKISVIDVQKILTKESGVLGISSVTSDFRELEKRYSTYKRAKLSINMFCRRVTKYISGYSSLMCGRLDAIVFTGGIGENSSFIRQKIIKKLSLLNFFVDVKKNIKNNKKIFFINTSASSSILVIKANENQVIAKETYDLLK
ncbi:Acetate kinase [Buchnera aphidicola (Cinara kochiana kochiana)]|uniref:Acetate kinase n=1 Tax=Buchnera aphidicola (Cinara kochiana kochiana) TaxID=2518976 RepID=A0A451D5B9_9GAMM|nr:acetate/propionate family kinase [Buchnera aphidicola]VFP81039.1 Acetate kinase [Buchnera aphidicola (Cinara kochiana kochiana)]